MEASGAATPSSPGRAAGATVIVVGHRDPVLAIGDRVLHDGEGLVHA